MINSLINHTLLTRKPWSPEQSKVMLGLDDLLVLYEECADENDIEATRYIYCVPNFCVFDFPKSGNKVICPTCHHSQYTHAHKYIQRNIDDLPIREHRTVLCVLFRTYRCYASLFLKNNLPNSCPTFRPNLLCAGKSKKITLRLEEKLKADAFSKTTFSQVAYNNFVSPTQVKKSI